MISADDIRRDRLLPPLTQSLFHPRNPPVHQISPTFCMFLLDTHFHGGVALTNPKGYFRMHKRSPASGITALALVLVGSAAAQVTARLSGSVIDQTGSAVPVATVDVFLPGGAK